MSSLSDSNRVTLSVPARTEFLQLLRLNVAGMAGAAFDVDEIEDLKIAVEELAALLLGVSEGEAELHVTLSLGADMFIVSGARRIDAGEPPELADFLPTILEAVVDRYSFATVEGVTRFEFEKHLRGD